MVSVAVLTATTLMPMGIVELNDTLRQRRFVVKVVPAKVDVPLKGVVHERVVGSVEISPEVKMRE